MVGFVLWGMSNELVISGSSDDIILVSGVVVDELLAHDTKNTLVRVSPGYVIDVEYTLEGEWEFDVVEEPEDANYEVVQVGEMDDSYRSYSGGVIIDHADEEEYTVEIVN